MNDMRKYALNQNQQQQNQNQQQQAQVVLSCVYPVIRHD